MIDYAKGLINDTGIAERLYNNSLLQPLINKKKFKNGIIRETKATYIKEYKEILFCFFLKDDVFTKLEILFKPHYYYNNNLHNANDFNVFESIKIINEFIVLFDIEPTKIKVLNLEFGVNVLSPIDCENLVLYTQYHSKNIFQNSSDNLKYSKVSSKAKNDGKANKYKMIKFYNKGIQFPKYSNINTLRIEVKSKESKYINTLGVFTFADLLDYEVYKVFASSLLIEISNLLILDVNNSKDNLTIKEQNKLDTFLNTLFWAKVLQDDNRNKFSNEKKKYFKLLDKTNDNIHLKLSKIVTDKLDDLLKRCAVSTTSTAKGKSQKVCNFDYIYNSKLHYLQNNDLQDNAITEVSEINPSQKGCNETITSNKNRCFVTGLKLDLESAGANYIRTKTLRYLQEYKKEVFESVVNDLCSNSYKHPKWESSLITHLAKQIRNRYYNPIRPYSVKRNFRGGDNQLSMF